MVPKQFIKSYVKETKNSVDYLKSRPNLNHKYRIATKFFND